MKYSHVHYRLVVISCAILLLVGCKDFLDLKPKGKDIPETIDHYNGMFNSTTLTSITYSLVTELGTKLGENILYNIFMSDELTATQSSISYLDFKMNQAYGWEGKIFSEEDNACEWASIYQQIYTFNVIINDVLDATGGTDKRKLELQAEARVNRAFRYLILAQYFGKPYDESTSASDLCVPIIEEGDMNLKNLKRNTVREVYDFIIKELEESCPDLVESTNHPLRIYQCAGWFFLGRAYWMKGDYENARIALEKALKCSEINATGLQLWDYNQMISQWGYNPSKPHAWTSGFPANNTGANKEVIYNYQYAISTISSATGQPKLFVKDEYMDLYGEDDLRRRFFSNKATSGTPLEGYRRLPCRTTFSLGADMTDLYLMLIECQVRSTDLSIQNEGRVNLEYFRRHRMPAETAVIPDDIDNQEKLIRFVVEERLREYTMTGIRWFDMRRLWNDPLFQDLKSGYTHTDGVNNYTLTEDRLVYQIPPKVLVFNENWLDNK